ncbi:DUF350 domain-containing protein [Rhodococcus sp. HM1]|uniref:DUF350 domain-containing protein n=1 Tax=unclassified Rhodococcus (in: high G+C Gram-positive bacteria) TaxID=192944 RepID=UPI0018CFC9BF|nr:MULTISPECIES: DUF350 domain-containing protein [unclassified Rhodococcus (in: high G+C Gram-positive bacteria)]MBH0119605.1 DUF350 domain-containing protein [Rhodococcus sp. CX]MCK8675556.1 DUF350 domain-containing protein [Rhodococcus sp. HM1]
MTVTWLAADIEIGTVDPVLLVGGVLATLAYFVVGIGVLAAGFAVLDALTPGNLRHQVYVDRNPNAALLLGANHLALAIIVVTAILTSSDGFAQGLVDSAVYGLVGIVLQAVALVIMNRALPGRLVSLVGEPHMSGAAWAVAVTLVSVGLVNAAALS